MANLDDAATQAAEMLDLFPQLVRADRETILRYMRARVAKTRADKQEDEAQERLFIAPIATLVVAQNFGVF